MSHDTAAPGRRSVVLSLACAIAAASGAGTAASAGAAAKPGNIDALCQALGGDESARFLGGRYLSTRPGEADAERLLSALAASGVDFGSLESGRRAAFLESVRSVARAEFATGAVVDVGGWIMSRTEMQVMALVHIRHAGAAAG